MKAWDDLHLLEEMYYERDMSQYEIADELGCDRSVISKRMKRGGLTDGVGTGWLKQRQKLMEQYPNLPWKE